MNGRRSGTCTKSPAYEAVIGRNDVPYTARWDSGPLGNGANGHWAMAQIQALLSSNLGRTNLLAIDK